MSDLENFNPVESSESSGNASPEISEKFKEVAKKWSAWIQRTRKDEKKAQKYDNILAHMLRDIVKNKDFDELFDPLFDCIDKGYPSSFLVGIFSLIHHPAHIKIRETSGKDIFHFHYRAKEEQSSFHDQFIDREIKNRINVWIEDTIDALLFEPSSLLTERLKDILDTEEEDVNIFLSYTFYFFLKKLNIDVSLDKSKSYARFIRSEIQKSLKNISLEEI